MRRMHAHVACAVPRQLASLRAAAHAARWEGCAAERSASARVQQIGGAVLMQKGELVFDGVALSDTSATARRPPHARAGRPLRLRACGGPAPDRRHVQVQGGAVYMIDGAVTFRGSSTITRTRAVRPAQRTRSHADTHLEYWFAALALALALVLDVVSHTCTYARAGECAHDMRAPTHTRAYEQQEQQQQQQQFEQDS
jgi:hypothetical protein